MGADPIVAGTSGVRTRERLTIQGLVQGVGFRPFVYALARRLGLSGSVGNDSSGVIVEVEGTRAAVDEFAESLVRDLPPLARVDAVAREAVPPRGGTDFVIAGSTGSGGRTLVSPDIATCAECLAELADPGDRRHRHAFISCTNCGPRFTIVVDLPYDRPTTTMAELPLCADCAAEYADPADRRFHAQTVACRDCGPTLTLRRPGQSEVIGDDAIAESRQLLAAGAIVAVKGLGGYHLACDAADSTAVATLRKRKDRGDKPFAVMVPDLETAMVIADVSATERALLLDARRPVVLLNARSDGSLRLADDVAPGARDVGVMLAYTPVHRLLFGLAGDPPGPQVLVMTSGNLSGEPIVIDDTEALERLDGLADAWLAHDRPIQVPCDDSVVRASGSQILPVRRSRGFAPMPLSLPVRVDPTLAVGGDLKNTFCVGDGGYAWMSAHVGDMDDLATQRAFATASAHLSTVTRVSPEVLVADRHPAYRSASLARRQANGRPVRTVQHHHAHVASAMAENGYAAERPVIGFAFDGTGYGDDGCAWGGEVLVADYDGFERAAHLRYTWLPGGDSGVRNPCRMALSHLYEAGLAWDPALPPVRACTPTERAVLGHQVKTGLNSVRTSSMGRLFDAVSSLAGVCHRAAYEAEAAMRFESIARAALDDGAPAYRFGIVPPVGGGPLVADPAPVIARAAEDVRSGVPPEVIAACFHIAVANLVVAMADRLRTDRGLETVALSGGVFLNAVLTDLCSERLQQKDFRVLTHHLVPPSDAGLALGQLVVAGRHVAHERAASPSEGDSPCA
jgi:hydrogenase maturation protein HypF